VVPIHGCQWYTTTVCVVEGQVDNGWKPKEEKQGRRERETENAAAMLPVPRVRWVRVRNSVS